MDRRTKYFSRQEDSNILEKENAKKRARAILADPVYSLIWTGSGRGGPDPVPTK